MIADDVGSSPAQSIYFHVIPICNPEGLDATGRGPQCLE